MQRAPPAAEQVVGLVGPLIPADRTPVGRFGGGVAAREPAEHLFIRRLGVLLAALPGQGPGAAQQQPGCQLAGRPVTLPGVVLESVRAENAKVRCPDLPEPLDQARVGLLSGVDVDGNEVLADRGGDRRLTVADLCQRRATASSGREEVDQDQSPGRFRIYAGSVDVGVPPLDRFHGPIVPGQGLADRARGSNHGVR